MFFVACNCVNGAVAAYNAMGNKLFWLHSLVLSVISTFGGGFIAPMLIAKPAQALNNDVIMFCCVAAWFVVHYCRGHQWLQLLPIKMFWMCFLGIFRSNAVTNIVATSNSIFAKSAYYPTPLFGPIITGTVLGGMGQFLPFDKGLVAISKGTPWNIQGAFYTASFYHFMVNDKEGFIGQAFRSVLGEHAPSTVVMMIAAMQVLQLELHALCTPEANLFAPIHAVLYAIIPVNRPAAKPVDIDTPLAGWNRQARKRLATIIDLGRLTLVVGVFLLHLNYYVLPTSVKTVSTNNPFISSLAPCQADGDSVLCNSFSHDNSISVKEYDTLFLKNKNAFDIDSTLMGSCQWLSSLRTCKPYIVRFEKKDETFYLNTYSSVVPRNGKVDNFGELIRSIALASTKSDAAATNNIRLSFLSSGQLMLHSLGVEDSHTLTYAILSTDGKWKNSPEVMLNFYTGDFIALTSSTRLVKSTGGAVSTPKPSGGEL